MRKDLSTLMRQAEFRILAFYAAEAGVGLLIVFVTVQSFDGGG
jgi:hypothetical protein